MRVRADAPRDACEAYVGSHPEATAYHHPAWTVLIGRAFGHQTEYLAAESAGRVVGVLPLVYFSSRLFGRFAVSLPFVNYGGVLADTPDAGCALVDAAIERTRAAGGSHLELRHTSPQQAGLIPRRHKVAMTLELAATADEAWTRLDRKVRNQVRKAEKHGLVATSGGVELLPEFYAVFARNMRDLGTPVYSRQFFDAVASAFPASTRVFVVRQDGLPLAASLTHWHRGVIEVPWASALRESNRVSANVLLYWRMLAFAIEKGFRRFDFGRSTPGEGTYQFKKQWGAAAREMVWEYWTAGGAVPDLSPANAKYGLAIRVWQHLPVSLATAVGPSIVRNIP